MDIKGQKIRSKATGATGTIEGIQGNNVLVNFVGNTIFPVPIETLSMDEELEKAVREELNSVNAIRKTSSVTRNRKGIYTERHITELDPDDRVEFYRNVDVLNECFGTNYKAWMTGSWVLNNKYWVWFPKLANTLKDEPVAHGCTNVISGDWNTIIYDDYKDGPEHAWNHPPVKLVFAREPNNGPILFRGVYIEDEEQTSYKHYVSKRIAKKVRFIGNPVFDIEEID